MFYGCYYMSFMLMYNICSFLLQASRKVFKCGYLFVSPNFDFTNPSDRTRVSKIAFSTFVVYFFALNCIYIYMVYVYVYI